MSPMERVCERFKVRLTATIEGKVPDGWVQGTTAWKMVLRMGQKRLTVPYFTGPAICEEPSPADVLSCLISDARAGELPFPEFAGDMGYDEDSRKAEAIHRACVRMGPKVRAFLGGNFDEFANAEH